MSVDSKGASSSGSSVAISIELPAVNVLDEKIKQLQRDREALKAQRKQVAKELKAKKKLAVKKARATRGLSDEMLMEEVRKRMLRRPSAASGTPETEEVSKE
jgi:seryl-tRNA synthetase